MVLFCCCCNYATVGHVGTQIFNFVVLSVIIAPQNVLAPHNTLRKPISLLFYLM